MTGRMVLASQHSRSPRQHGNSEHDPIQRKRCEAALADPTHEPGDGSVGNDERDNETDGEDDPLVGRDLGDADGILIFAAERLEERVERGHCHGGHGKKKGELERGGSRHSHELSGGDRRHGRVNTLLT